MGWSVDFWRELLGFDNKKRKLWGRTQGFRFL